jgi:hypothetical protein
MKIAIQGDPIRWRDIMKALIGIGAEDCPTKTCGNSKFIYFIGGWYNKTICNDDLTIRKTKDYVIYTIEEFENYSYKQNKDTGEYTDEPLDNGFCHLVDGLRYAYSVRDFNVKPVHRPHANMEEY